MHKWRPRPVVYFLFFIFIGEAAANAIDFDRTQLIINGVTYTLEIAKTSKQRQQGLMFRQQLDIREGMLFIYPQPGNHRIWMKNTRIPLSVIWLDENGVVIDVQILSPCDSDPCQSYGVSRVSKYIIELNSRVLDISPGDGIKGLKQLVQTAN
ncbi:MAG: DUF192 domain-containing protein [Gammaproteobacteria bacterium]|nr:DUF192 domain-containing protein [Gammaproteobacteria bacterium]